MSKKLVRVTRPRIRLTKRGLRVQAPRARVGGLNISKSGVSYSVRTKAGTLNTKRGCSLRHLPGCGLVLSLLLATAVITVRKN